VHCSCESVLDINLESLIEEPPPLGVGNRFAAVRGAHLRKESGELAFDLQLAETEAGGDFRWCISVGEHLERRALPRCDSQHDPSPHNIEIDDHFLHLVRILSTRLQHPVGFSANRAQTSVREAA
jgi:hypothetical protein